MRSTVFQVRNIEDRPVAGADSCIAAPPDQIYLGRPGDTAALNVPVLARMLRQLGNDMASRIGETLHHADWVITDEADVVEEVGMHGRPDCVRCRASVDQALAHLKATQEPLIVGALYWAG